MRRELFQRGVITPQAFEGEVREKAIRSQVMEGVHDPLSDEPADIWETRLTRVRDHLTDFYFAYNLPYELFEQIVKEALSARGALDHELGVAFNPELAPQSMLFDQAVAIEALPPHERERMEARLREIKVVLIRTMISDHLAYVNIAKEWFTIDDLNKIRERKIGQGKIGGKSAGMLLAARILNEAADEEIRSCMHIPDSYFIGADLTYGYMTLNSLMYWGDQKYKEEAQIRAEYPQLQKEFLKGEFPADIVTSLRGVLEQVGKKPIIVRSSSLLEDNFGTSFAGKYESHFCPNQDSAKKNLAKLLHAIKRIYASVFNPDALLYRRAKGLQDYDERMAILIQTVEGERFGRYFLPHASGVAFSRNLYRWSPQIRREDGFVRLVWGLGTRAVDRVGNDYPRLVALSHPMLHPQDTIKGIRHYSQQYVDLLDLEENTFKTLPIEEVIQPRYPTLRYLAQLDQDGYLSPLRSMVMESSLDRLVITFDELFRRTPLAKRLREIVRLLEKHYHSPVDTEFAVRIVHPETLQPEVQIAILQCRPQSHLKDREVSLPQNLDPEDIIFSTRRMAPRGHVTDVRYVVFVTPECYLMLPTPAARAEMSQAIQRLNAALANEQFILVGPGRWGTSNPDLGIHIGYGDIHHTRALVELAGQGMGHAPEASFGTHFFQDLVESNIYPLAVYLDDEGAIFNRAFFYRTPNRLKDFLNEKSMITDCIHLIEVADYRPGYHLELVMDDDEGLSVAYLAPDQ
jgi:hypothetical protein